MTRTTTLKPLIWMGSSHSDLRAFPEVARRDAGFSLDLVQQGGEPVDWKPMSGVGVGVREIRVRDETGAYRVMYLATRSEAVYVLHCFQKKTEKTSRRDIDLAVKRFKAIPEPAKRKK